MNYDEAYANAPFIPGADAFPPAWAARSQALREQLGDRFRSGLRYGPAPRNWLHLCLPETAPAGLAVIIHGGYWLRFSPDDFAHLATGALARGWAVAMPAYTLAPAARIGQITAEIAVALTVAASEVAGPIAVAGHSAGGHLAARMACGDVPLPAAVAGRIVRCLPVSPVADLRPLMRCSMNADLGLDRAEADAESPVLLSHRPDVATHVWVGGAERPVFLDQARRLGKAWACPVTIDAGRHHFDVIEGFEHADSPLMAAFLGSA